jgi:hypothetical protein
MNFIKITTLALLITSVVYADDNRDALDDLRSNIHKAVIANTNALMVFTSQDMISSGKYKLTNTQHDTDLRIISFPFLYHLKSDEFYNFFVQGAVGYSVMETKVSVIEDMTPDFTSFETYIAKIGGGIRLKSDYGFETLLGVSIIYSHIYNTYDFRNELSEYYKEVFEEEFANRALDNISYDLYLEFAYRPEFNGWKPYAVINYNYYDTKSLSKINEFEHFTTRSSVSSIYFGCESAQLFDIYAKPITFEAYTSATLVTGDIKDSLDFEGYGEWGLLSHMYLAEDELYPITEFYIGYSEVHADGINGYNLGFGVSVSF